MEEFDLQKLDNLTPSQSQEYITNYFVPLATGNHAVYINGNFTIMENAIVKSTYFKRMSKELNTWYFEKYKKLRHIEYKLNKDLFYENKINLCPQFKHKYKKYEEFSNEIKLKVDNAHDGR